MSISEEIVLSAADDLKLWRSLNGRISVDRKACLLSARDRGHSSWFRPWRKTRAGPGRLTIDEFLYYDLNAPQFDDSSRSRFAGKRVQARAHRKCNDLRWFAVSHNKLLYQAWLQGNGMPAPELIATHKCSIADKRVHCLEDDKSLIDFLSTKDHYPLFIKPVEGMYSIGAMLLLDVDGDHIILNEKRYVRIEKLVAYLNEIDANGYLFQSVLEPHLECKDRFGIGLPAVRFVVMNSGEPKIEVATLKIPIAGNDADNFWRAGNMLAAVNLDSGRLSAAISGYAHEMKWHTEHPDTKLNIEAWQLPDWNEAISLVLGASSCLPGIRTQGWDVCLTTRGPILLELNFGGDFNLHQLSHRRGILSDEFSEHLRRCGYRGRLPSLGE